MKGPLTHVVRPAHVKEEDFKGEAKYRLLAQSTDELAEFYVFEDLLSGFVSNSSLGGTTECKNALVLMIYYGFEMLKRREIYKPSNTMKLFIAYQGMQE